jgi:uncharacterized RDD family membrane protein YckC
MSEEVIYANSFKRGAAVFIDLFIVSFLRIIFLEINGELWYKQQLINFTNDFKAKFGVDVIGKVPAQIEYLAHHSIITSSIILFLLIMLVGALYHALLNSSSWSATFGKRIMGIILINSDGRKLSFLEAFGHYLLSLFPWIFMVYIVSFQNFHSITIFQAITANPFNILFGLVTIAWIQIHSITKRKVTTHDLICKTVMVEGRVGGKFPKVMFK